MDNLHISDDDEDARDSDCSQPSDEALCDGPHGGCELSSPRHLEQTVPSSDSQAVHTVLTTYSSFTPIAEEDTTLAVPVESLVDSVVPAYTHAAASTRASAVINWQELIKLNFGSNWTLRGWAVRGALYLDVIHPTLPYVLPVIVLGAFGVLTHRWVRSAPVPPSPPEHPVWEWALQRTPL